jgi:N6-adenosine-specific RNA methylase IME4
MRPTKYRSDEARVQARVAYNQRYHAKRQLRKQLLPLPPGPYRVLYADPPWQYFSTDPFIGTRPADYYPAMSIAELCALPVRKVVAPKAILFLWVTAPLLEECFPVVKAWGFKYKTNLVWHKGAHAYGNYLRTEHEHLLLCTRGACYPEVQDRFPSVHKIARTTHSTKPAEIRLLIDTLYPEGRRLELFARGSTPAHWDIWGNEAAGCGP